MDDLMDMMMSGEGSATAVSDKIKEILYTKQKKLMLQNQELVLHFLMMLLKLKQMKLLMK